MIKVIARNKKAFHDYTISDKLEAGMVLTGTEVKSLRAGNVRIAESYVWTRGGELFIVNMHIPEYKQGNINNHIPTRERKLLLKRSEAERLISRVQEKGFVLVPLSIYFKDQWVKIEIGLGKGKKLWDKRETIKKKDMDRETERALRERK